MRENPARGGGNPASRWAIRGMTSLLIAVAIFLAFMLALLWWAQERIAYQPQRPPYPEAGEVTRIDYRAADGQPLLAYVVGDPRTARGTLLVFHGNADLAAWQLEWAQDVERTTGHAVFLAEYRGYMGLPGRPTYAGLVLDGRAAYGVLTGSLGAPAERISFFGHSLGTAIAAELAIENRPRALILLSPFTSAHDMVGRIVTRPIAYFWRFVSRIPYDTRARVAAVDAPVWVAHGERDGIIPVRMGHAVYAAAKVKGELLIVEGARHEDLQLVGAERYQSWFSRALGGALTTPPQITEETARAEPSPTR